VSRQIYSIVNAQLGEFVSTMTSISRSEPKDTLVRPWLDTADFDAFLAKETASAERYVQTVRDKDAG
jgi:hypothetical protein